MKIWALATVSMQTVSAGRQFVSRTFLSPEVSPKRRFLQGVVPRRKTVLLEQRPEVPYNDTGQVMLYFPDCPH